MPWARHRSAEPTKCNVLACEKQALHWCVHRAEINRTLRRLANGTVVLCGSGRRSNGAVVAEQEFEWSEQKLALTGQLVERESNHATIYADRFRAPGAETPGAQPVDRSLLVLE